jgi:RNA polymerase sigma-70 factor (ECF subfamily)
MELGTILTTDMRCQDGDELFVTRAKDDPNAFAALYERYFDPVYWYCFRRLGHPETAADTTAQIFMRAFAALPDYHNDAGSFRRWLFTIAHNTVVDAARRRKPVDSLGDSMTMVDPARSPEEQAVAQDQQQQLRGLLEQLTPDQRQVVELRLAGLTGQEIADVMGRSLTAVKSTQFRAYTRLRRLLIDAGYDPME